jgi:hypothetical protein
VILHVAYAAECAPCLAKLGSPDSVCGRVTWLGVGELVTGHVQALFHDTLQAVFAEKPDDPLKFVVERLQKQLRPRDAKPPAASPTS